MLLNVKAYRDKNNIPPLQGNYLISALPCHCKPLLSASAPRQPLIPHVFQLFPRFQDVSAPKSLPASRMLSPQAPNVVTPGSKCCHPRLWGTVTRGMPGPSASHLAAALPSSPAQRRARLSSCPTILSLSAGSADCAILSPSAWIISTVALRSSRRRWSSFGGTKEGGKLPDWGSRTKSSPWRGQIFNCGSEPLPAMG